MHLFTRIPLLLLCPPARLSLARAGTPAAGRGEVLQTRSPFPLNIKAWPDRQNLQKLTQFSPDKKPGAGRQAAFSVFAFQTPVPTYTSTYFTMTKSYTFALLLILAFAGILSPPAFGQDTLRTLPIKEVVVTATRTEQAALETPRSVAVISSREIENSVYTNVAELLSRTVGMYIVGTGQTPGAHQNIFLRGANSNHVNILIDGVRINDPSSPNSALDLSELSLLNVERIEVIRGSLVKRYLPSSSRLICTTSGRV